MNTRHRCGDRSKRPAKLAFRLRIPTLQLAHASIIKDEQDLLLLLFHLGPGDGMQQASQPCNTGGRSSQGAENLPPRKCVFRTIASG